MPTPDPHRGGCAFCQYVDPQRRMLCTHPSYPVPLPFDSARDDLERCGPRGRYWEPYWDPRLELTAPEGRP
jgi:hypothetical protein